MRVWAVDWEGQRVVAPVVVARTYRDRGVPNDDCILRACRLRHRQPLRDLTPNPGAVHASTHEHFNSQPGLQGLTPCSTAKHNPPACQPGSMNSEPRTQNPASQPAAQTFKHPDTQTPRHPDRGVNKKNGLCLLNEFVKMSVQAIATSARLFSQCGYATDRFRIRQKLKQLLTYHDTLRFRVNDEIVWRPSYLAGRERPCVCAPRIRDQCEPHSTTTMLTTILALSVHIDLSSTLY